MPTTAVLLSGDIQTLMDLLQAEIQSLRQQPGMAIYGDYLVLLKDRLTRLSTEMLPGQEVICTIRERK